MDYRDWISVGLFGFHYAHRAFVYTLLRMKVCGPTSVFGVVMSAFVFTSLNGYVMTKYSIFWYNGTGPGSDLKLVIGVVIFFVGFAINYHSDHILLNLRKPGEVTYKVPRGGAFEWVTSANYFGEILEWVGFSVAFTNPASVGFVFNSCCNLVPRARSTFKWYQQKFPEEDWSQKKSICPILY